MRTLEALEFLNGLKVERDILYEDEDDEEQDDSVLRRSASPKELNRPNIYTINSEGRREDDEDEEEV